MKKQVIAVVDDLLFASKIRGAAEQAGAEVRLREDGRGASGGGARRGADAVVILDLQTSLLDPFAAAEAVEVGRADARLKVVGFFPHVQADLQRRAQAARDRLRLPALGLQPAPFGNRRRRALSRVYRAASASHTTGGVTAHRQRIRA